MNVRRIRSRTAVRYRDYQSTSKPTYDSQTTIDPTSLCSIVGSGDWPQAHEGGAPYKPFGLNQGSGVPDQTFDAKVTGVL